LATRLAAQLYELLKELGGEPGGEQLSDDYVSVLIKALLVHGACWGPTEQLITNALQAPTKDALTRLLGYGAVLPERLFECTDQRATIVGWGILNDGEAHRFQFPLPASLSGQRTWRRLTLTLAWLTPTNPSHPAYRLAHLWADPYGANNGHGCISETLKVNRRAVDYHTVRRGTVQHEIFEGERAGPFTEDEPLFIQVNCCADAGKLVQSVPYALVSTLEVAEGVSIPIYDEMRNLIR
jgi:hypothetical protein